MPSIGWERFPCTETTVVELRGELDMATAAEAYATVVEATDTSEAPCVVVDLSEVTFMDVSGIRVLLRAWTELTRAGRHLVLAEPVPSVARLFDTLDLRRFFPIYPVVEAALADHARASAQVDRERST